MNRIAISLISMALAMFVTAIATAQDRRPIGLIWTGPGGTGWPPADIASDGARHLKERPWKRVMWHMPASWDAASGHMSGAQWWTLTRDQRTEFRRLNRLANSLGKRFYVYGGIAMESAMSLKFDRQPPKVNNFYDAGDHYAMWELVIEPWRNASCDGWLFDAGSHAPFQQSALAWCKWLREEHGMWTAIEAFPLKNCPNCEIDEKVALQCPAVARYDFNPSAPDLIAPEGSELHVWTVAIPDAAGGTVMIDGVNWRLTMTSDEVAGWLKRGFIVDPDEPHDKVVIEGYQKAGMAIP